MTRLSQQHHVASSMFFIALILSNHGIAMAYRMKQSPRVQGVGAVPVGGRRIRQVLDHHSGARQFSAANSRYSTFTCDELKTEMAQKTSEAARQVLDHHSGVQRFSTLSSGQIQAVATLTIQISSIAEVADKKLCLPEILDSDRTISNFEHFKSAEDIFLESATSPEARDRFGRAFARLRDAQSSLLSMHGHIFNRRLLFPSNIEDPSVCPWPCLECTREHNSWWEDAEEFSFKCILNAGDPKPAGWGFTCPEPTARNSNSNQHKTWCEVHHWQESAAQTLDVSATAACGARSVLAPLQHGNDMTESQTATCRKEVMGEAVTQEELDDFRALDEEIDGVVTAGNLATFSMFMIVELVTTVSELRLRTRSDSSFMERDETSDTQPEMNVSHSQHRYTAGSWRCRRSVLSLAAGLFGAMIDIVVGVAYLAIMGSFGLIAAMSVLGPDAVIRVFSDVVPSIGEHWSWMSWTTDQAGRLVDHTQGQAQSQLTNILAQEAIATQAAQAGMASGVAGAQAAAAASGAALTAEGTVAAMAAGEAAAAVVVEQTGAAASAAIAQSADMAIVQVAAALESISATLALYWPYILGGASIAGILFGIWGLMRIWHSFDSPYDCSSGYVKSDGEAVCHPAMTFGEAHDAPCPGADAAHQVGFICSERNRGIITFTNNCQLD